MASSHEQHQLHTPYSTTAAPPPTPSSQSNLLSTSAAAETLSRLLHRLPPTLSLPTRRPSPLTTTSPLLISLSDPTPSLHANLLSATQLGFFQLTNHSILSELAQSAESDSLSLFSLPHDQKKLHFPKNWPLGFNSDDIYDDEENETSMSFCFESSSSSALGELSLTSLHEFTREMEKVGFKVIEALSCAVGFENPVSKDPAQLCSLMWVSEGLMGDKPDRTSKMYPYVVGLQYQLRCQRYKLLSDSGAVSVLPQIDSILITLGDIAQVWSNGKLKKVRGRAMPSLGDDGNSCITMTLLLTLPLDSTVSPLIPKLNDDGDDDQDDDENENIIGDKRRLFNSFSFEDYAWRLYHERLHLKDPLYRYRV